MNNQTAIGAIISGFVIIMIGYFFFFGFGNYNNPHTNKLPNPNEGNEKVYGESLEAPAYQTQLEYDENPETEKRANALRDKMFPKEKEQDLPKADSTVAEANAEEEVEDLEEESIEE